VNIREHTFSFREFYFRRMIRLFPALIIVVLSTLFFGKLLLFPDEINQLARYVIASTGFVTNFLSWSEAGYFDASSTTKPLLHLWSLGIEEQFYIFWPLIIWFARKSDRKLFVTILLLFSSSFIFNIYISQTSESGAFFSPVSRLWELATGGILAFVIAKYLNLALTNTLQGTFISATEETCLKFKNLVKIVWKFTGFLGICIIIFGSLMIEGEKISQVFIY